HLTLLRKTFARRFDESGVITPLFLLPDSLPYRKCVLKTDTHHLWYTTPCLRPFPVRRSTMSDTYRRYRAIKQAIMQFYRPQPSGHQERHFNTLVALICGLAGGQRADLPTIADHAPCGRATQESLIGRFRRWLKHDAQTLEGWFLPVAQQLLATLATQPIMLVMDGSVVGRG